MATVDLSTLEEQTQDIINYFSNLYTPVLALLASSTSSTSTSTPSTPAPTSTSTSTPTQQASTSTSTTTTTPTTTTTTTTPTTTPTTITSGLGSATTPATALLTANAKKTFLSELQKLSKESNFKQLSTFLIDQQSLIFSDVPDKDIEACFSLMTSLIARNDSDVSVELTRKLLAAITSNTSDRPLLRLKILNNLYNTAAAEHSSGLAGDILVAIVEYSIKTQTTDVVLPHLHQITNSKTVSRSLLRTLLHLRHTIYAQKDKPFEAFRSLLAYLETFESENEETLASVVDSSVKAALLAITLPEVHEYDRILSLRAIAQLGHINQYKNLFELLNLFATKDFHHFNAWISKNPNFLSSLEISQDELVKKIRLLSLVSLASSSLSPHTQLSSTEMPVTTEETITDVNSHAEQPKLHGYHTANEIPYDVIASSLGIEMDEVESWVITAISRGLIDAKLDQLKRVLVVSRCIQRVFTLEHWKTLNARLHSWRDSVASLLQVVRSQIQQ